MNCALLHDYAAALVLPLLRGHFLISNFTGAVIHNGYPFDWLRFATSNLQLGACQQVAQNLIARDDSLQVSIR